MDNKLKNILIGFSLFLFTTSCIKYDEGGLSINVDKRISKNDWIEDTTFIIKSSIDNYKYQQLPYSLILKKNGDVCAQIVTADSIYINKLGTWEIIDHNKILQLVYLENLTLKNHLLLQQLNIEIDTTLIKDTITYNPIIEKTFVKCPIIKFNKNCLWVTTLFSYLKTEKGYLPFTFEIHYKTFE